MLSRKQIRKFIEIEKENKRINQMIREIFYQDLMILRDVIKLYTCPIGIGPMMEQVIDISKEV